MKNVYDEKINNVECMYKPYELRQSMHFLQMICVLLKLEKCVRPSERIFRRGAPTITKRPSVLSRPSGGN